MNEPCHCIGKMKHRDCPRHGEEVRITTAHRNLRAVQVTFGMDADDEPFTAYTDDTRWNGFLNVWVTQKTHDRFNEIFGEPPDPFVADNRGLIYYGGGAVIVEEHNDH